MSKHIKTSSRDSENGLIFLSVFGETGFLIDIFYEVSVVYRLVIFCWYWFFLKAIPVSHHKFSHSVEQRNKVFKFQLISESSYQNIQRVRFFKNNVIRREPK